MMIFSHELSLALSAINVFFQMRLFSSSFMLAITSVSVEAQVRFDMKVIIMMLFMLT